MKKGATMTAEAKTAKTRSAVNKVAEKMMFGGKGGKKSC